MCERLAPWVIQHCVLPDKAANLHKSNVALFFLSCQLHNEENKLCYWNSVFFYFLIGPSGYSETLQS